jgi:hypothetical protein
MKCVRTVRFTQKSNRDEEQQRIEMKKSREKFCRAEKEEKLLYFILC